MFVANIILSSYGLSETFCSKTAASMIRVALSLRNKIRTIEEI